ncbi:hypothetical protein KCU66_g42, partial [Aureobasidium melanogenum]
MAGRSTLKAFPGMEQWGPAHLNNTADEFKRVQNRLDWRLKQEDCDALWPSDSTPESFELNIYDAKQNKARGRIQTEITSHYTTLTCFRYTAASLFEAVATFGAGLLETEEKKIEKKNPHGLLCWPWQT